MLIKDKKKIKKAFNLLADNQSKKIFKQFLSAIFNFRVPQISKSKINNMYIEKKINYMNNFSKTNILNAGAYDGDTVRHLLKNHIPINSILCVEPNKYFFAKLTAYINNLPKRLFPKIFSLNTALGSFNGKVKFNPTLGMNSRALFTGEDKVANIKLDKLYNFFNFSHLIADIEGSEFFMLKGAKKLLKKYSPNLAISTYHYPNDIYRLIININIYSKNYRFYLRNYTSNCEGTVLYAIKK